MSSGASQGRTTHRIAAWLVLVGLLTTLNYAGRFTVDPDPPVRSSDATATGPGKYGGTPAVETRDGPVPGGVWRAEEELGGVPVDPARDVLYRWSSFFAGLVQFSVMLGVVLAIAAGNARELLGLRRPRSWPAAIGLAFGVLVGVLVLSAALSPFVDAGDEQGLLPEQWDPSRAAPFLANALLIAGFTPVVEELMFRGLGFSLFIRFGLLPALLAAGVLFGPAHGLVLGLPLLAAFGVGLAYLRYRTDSVLPCILLHAVFNAIALAAAVTLGADG